MSWLSAFRGLNPRIQFGAKVAVSAILLALLITRLDIEELILSVANLSLDSLGLVTWLSITFIILKIVKWRVLIDGSGLHIPVQLLVRSFLVSLAIGVITPGRIGEAARIAPHKGADRAKALRLYIFDRGAELLVILALGLPAAAQLGRWARFAFALFSLAVTLALLVLSGRLPMGQHLVAWGSTLATGRAQMVMTLSESLKVGTVYWVVNVAGYMVGYALIASLIFGMTRVDSWWFLLALPLVTLSNVLPITIAGLGLREGLATLLLPQFGISAEVASAAFFLSFVLTILIPGTVGLGWSLVPSLPRSEQ